MEKQAVGFVLRWLIVGLGWLIGSIVLSTAWYRLWFYRSFPGAPGLLSRLLSAYGENAYDAVWAEMFLICALVLAVAALVGERLLRSRQRGRLIAGGLQ